MDLINENLLSQVSTEKPTFYIYKPVFEKISIYLQREPIYVRCESVYEDGWFNRKESYMCKRMKYDRKKGQYIFGISDIYRSYNGRRITKYTKYWVTEKDIYYINNRMELPSQEQLISVRKLRDQYQEVYLE